MLDGEEIEVRGFGSFRFRNRPPRSGRNPRTGDPVKVPPKKVLYFKPSKLLKELINKRDALHRRPLAGALHPDGRPGQGLRLLPRPAAAVDRAGLVLHRGTTGLRHPQQVSPTCRDTS